MTNQQNNKVIHISLWIAQGSLAILFLMAGAFKLSQPIEKLAESLPWVTSTPIELIRFIGLSEVLGGLGLIIPSLFRFKTVLTVWAALGLALVMLLAAIFHASRGEFPNIGMNIVLIAIALFIAWGRSKKAPIT